MKNCTSQSQCMVNYGKQQRKSATATKMDMFSNELIAMLLLLQCSMTGCHDRGITYCSYETCPGDWRSEEEVEEEKKQYRMHTRINIQCGLLSLNVFKIYDQCIDFAEIKFRDTMPMICARKLANIHTNWLSGSHQN